MSEIRHASSAARRDGRKSARRLATIRLLSVVGPIGLCLGALTFSSSCLSSAETGLSTYKCPPVTGVQTIHTLFERRCGSLDCHGNAARNFVVYGQLARRLDPEDTIGEDATTDAERNATLASACAIEPEVTDMVMNDEADPSELTLVRKPRLDESHKGGKVWQPDSDGDRCLLSWFSGSVNEAACQNEILKP